MTIFKKYGYARVSSKSQESNSSLDVQKQQLIERGIKEDDIRIEIGSGVNEIKNRPVFQDLIHNILKEGDTLIVTKLDRCSRNTLEFLKLQDFLSKRGIQFISLDLPYSDDFAVNKLISTTLSSIAEFETNRRKVRQMEGILIAKNKGKFLGRKSVIDESLIKKVKRLKEQKNLSVSEISQLTGKSRPTIYKVLKKHLGYETTKLRKIDHSK